MQAVVLAGGKGKRLEPLTFEIPKAMVPVNGMPIIEIILKQLSEIGVKEVVIVVNYLKEKIMDFVGDNIFGMKITYAVQKEAKGDGDALKYAEPYVNQDKFIMIACDSLFPTDHLKKIMRDDCDGVMTVCKVDDARRFGVIINEGDVVKKIVEKSPNPPTNLANTSIHYLPKEIFPTLYSLTPDKTGEYRIVYAIQKLINYGKIFKFQVVDKWLDIGTHEQLKEAQQLGKELNLCKL
ncbi:hypothetical protein DRJ22_03255 [Candidatus Woesearchaeota archaeon]|nr:MAG: hypothetical protein B6U93_01750 [Candidatus Woesearchaeota archaeon ex4484_78]RLE45923.1 MAG: hypothetical protein DRJ22_03255 [Candidatus Woesearchaeota archaeon]